MGEGTKPLVTLQSRARAKAVQGLKKAVKFPIFCIVY
jgi:hypothetical protein